MNASIRAVTLDDVMGLERYEQEREATRRRIIALKKNRRIEVGDCVSFVFENHDTVFFQVQEMLRAESITDLDAVREELEVYNAMLPQPGQLSATMLIAITDSDRIEERLNEMLGIDERVCLFVGEHRVAGEFEPGRSREDRLSAVQYVRFVFDESMLSDFCDEQIRVALSIDHKAYDFATEISGASRRSLIEDLAA